MSGAPVEAIAAIQPAVTQAQPPLAQAPGASFTQLMLNSIDQVNAKVTQADAMANAFAVDDSIPVHQVTYALEQARLSFQLMMEVRSRLLEGYQELLRMQV